MQPRRAVFSLLVVFLTLSTTPAMAAEIDPLTLSSHEFTVSGPVAGADRCDYTALNCGTVAVTAEFAGLTGRARPETEDGLPQLNLSGTVHVTRVYGCQNSRGRRLHRFDRRVSEDLTLNTRRGTPFRVPETGDTVSATSYAFLSDAQPGNCPSWAQPMTYRITASEVVLTLTSSWAPVPDGNYTIPGRARWRGAVPTPTPAIA